MTLKDHIRRRAAQAYWAQPAPLALLPSYILAGLTPEQAREFAQRWRAYRIREDQLRADENRITSALSAAVQGSLDRLRNLDHFIRRYEAQ